MSMEAAQLGLLKEVSTGIDGLRRAGLLSDLATRALQEEIYDRVVDAARFVDLVGSCVDAGFFSARDIDRYIPSSLPEQLKYFALGRCIGSSIIKSLRFAAFRYGGELLSEDGFRSCLLGMKEHLVREYFDLLSEKALYPHKAGRKINGPFLADSYSNELSRPFCIIRSTVVRANHPVLHIEGLHPVKNHVLVESGIRFRLADLEGPRKRGQLRRRAFNIFLAEMRENGFLITRAEGKGSSWVLSTSSDEQ